MRETPYQKLYKRKRKWTPVQTAAGKLKEGSEETIRRVLAIRHMELPVGDFIQASLNEIPEHSRELLLSNIKDEENHDLALGYAVQALGEDREAEAEAKRLRDAWISHPSHTIAKALVVERGIFFTLLPFMRFNGDAGLRTISADISRDEQIHVATNSLLCTELNLDIPPSLDKLRKATIAWIYQPLGINTTDKYLDKKFWQDQSDNLMYNGRTNGLFETKRARMPAFFEHSNVNLPQYA
ncbi:MAG: hypothetical protein CL779_00640 [Chloroflexi bacterium]|nr:hypothetical protein [Chloroflexota bacterium]